VISSVLYNLQKLWGAWVAQSAKCPTLDLSSGIDLGVMSSSPALGSTVGMAPTSKKEIKKIAYDIHTR